MTTKLARYIFLGNVKNDGKENVMSRVSLIDRKAWFTRLARYIEDW